MMAHQYYTPYATSSLCKVSLPQLFGSASYHLSSPLLTSPHLHHVPVAIGLRLRLTVTIKSVLGRGWLSCVVCVSLHHQEFHEEEGNGRTRHRSRRKATARQQKNVEQAALPLRRQEPSKGLLGQWRGTSVLVRVPSSYTKYLIQKGESPSLRTIYLHVPIYHQLHDYNTQQVR